MFGRSGPELLDEAADGIGVVRDRCVRRRIVRSRRTRNSMPGDQRVRVGEGLETANARGDYHSMRHAAEAAVCPDRRGGREIAASSDVDGAGFRSRCPPITGYPGHDFAQGRPHHGR